MLYTPKCRFNLGKSTDGEKTEEEKALSSFVAEYYVFFLLLPRFKTYSI